MPRRNGPIVRPNVDEKEPNAVMGQIQGIASNNFRASRPFDWKTVEKIRQFNASGSQYPKGLLPQF
jgi:hypothetical protein